MPVGYALPGMQLHVVAPSSHYASLPRVNNGPKNMQFSSMDQPMNSKFIERGVPEGAASIQSNDVALSPTNNQSPAVNSQVPTSHPTAQTGAVYYAMNV